MLSEKNKAVIELGDISMLKGRRQVRKAATQVRTAISTNNQGEEEDGSMNNKSSSIFKSITYDSVNEETKSYYLSTANTMFASTRLVRGRFKCLNGIFLKYFIVPRLSLKWCLIIIAIIDLIFGFTELMNFVSMKTSNVRPHFYAYSSLANFIFVLPIVAFEILLVKYYQLIQAKVLYGLKLFAGSFSVAV